MCKEITVKTKLSDLLGCVTDIKSIITPERKQVVEYFAEKNNFIVFWEYLHKQTAFSSDSVVITKCKICGNFDTRHVSSLRKGCFICSGCLSDKYATILADHGFSYINRGSNGKQRTSIRATVKCNTCNTISEMSTGNILRQKRIRCDVCWINSCKEILAKQGCEFIELISKNIKQRSIRYLTPCKHEKIARLYDVENCRFSKTGLSHWLQEHSLYCILLKYNGNTYVKIGTANNPINRLRTLKLDGDSIVITLFTFESRFLANNEEQRLHGLFSDYNLSTDISSDFTKGISKIGKLMGITEWFSSEILEELDRLYPNKGLTDGINWH